MTTYFVSCHPGAMLWAKEEGLHVDKHIEHLDIHTITAEDMVVGSLPVHMVADICEQGGRYLHLILDLPKALRGKELSSDDMRAYHARIEEITANRVSPIK